MSQQKPRQRGGRVLDKATPEQVMGLARNLPLTHSVLEKVCFVKLGSAFCAVFFRSVGSGFSAGCAVSAAACLRCVGYLVMRACSLR